MRVARFSSNPPDVTALPPSIRRARSPLRLAVAAVALCSATVAHADPLACDLSDYRAQPGLTAALAEDALTLTWDGDRGHEVRLRLGIDRGTPTLREIAVRASGGPWSVVATDVTPEVRVVSGVRRVTQQQTEPLEELGTPLTAETLDAIKWDAFWDAPLFVSDEPPLSHGSSIPAAEPFANHPGMPRRPEEVTRATARYHATGCTIRTNGARLEVTFPGVEAGIFAGYLQFDVFKGSNLIRQMVVAKTDEPSAAFKYDAGLRGLAAGPSSRLVWRDLAGQWQDHRLGGPVDAGAATVRGRNRTIAAELGGGSIAAFPPPHSFYWARESEQVLGYGWYRKDSTDAFAFGVRQAEGEEDPQFYQNFALYNARPGTWQRMPVFLYVSAGGGADAVDAALAFTRGDRFKPLPGHKVMGHHYHVGLVQRLGEMGGLDQRINDVATMKAVGVDIYGVIDGARGPGRHDRGELFLNDLATYYEAARRQSDEDFLVMPNDENSTGGRPPFLGGHYDLLLSKPVYWTPGREPGEPLTERHPTYGTVYHLGTPADLMEMAEREDVLVSMPHPRAKRSTGYPDAIRDAPHFLHERYFGLGYRWGMGIDASETRLGESRFLTLWDETNNWMAARGRPLKYALAISESRSDLGDRGKPPYDDAYGMSPVNYLQIDRVPSVDDMSPIVDALGRGDYFVTSGEVLVHDFAVEGAGRARTVVADVEWTFPLEFVEVVWGDGERTGREVVSATDLAPFGRGRFRVPLDTTGKAWVRFAAWDVATNGALVQPVYLDPPAPDGSAD